MTPIAVEKKHEMLTEDDVFAIISNGRQGKPVEVYAKEIGISPAYLRDIFQRRRSPGDSVLRHFGIRKTRRVIVEYTRERR